MQKTFNFVQSWFTFDRNGAKNPHVAMLWLELVSRLFFTFFTPAVEGGDE